MLRPINRLTLAQVILPRWTKEQCDKYLWDTFGDPATREERREVYGYMMHNFYNKAPTQ